MGTTWQIVPVSEKSTDFRWVWEEMRDGKVVARSEKTFQYYNECVEDARKRGYTPPQAERLR
jgi:hypothetical protein